MTRRDTVSTSPAYKPGEVLVLLTPLQELKPGMYLLHAIVEDWVTLRWLIDDEVGEQIVVTERESRLPVTLLRLFMPIGLRLATEGPSRLIH